MRLLTSGVWLLGGLLPFSPVAESRDADPTEDFCSLSSHMMAQRDNILYIAGGWMQYTQPYRNYTGPNTVLRSLDISRGFQISLDSPYYIKTEKVLDTIPGVSDAAFFPTESGFDLTFGMWEPYNSTIYGKRDSPVEDKKWQYDITTQQWTNTRVILKNWFETNTSRRISSAMTAWVPSLKKGFLFGGTFSSVNETSPNVTRLEEHNGLITYDQATNTWTNETTSFGAIVDGGLVHLTTATDEVLIQFGGTYGWAPGIRKFSEINIYSITRSKWYTQHLPPEAEVPAPRYAFCTALKSASDGSSHQIYIIGGIEDSTSEISVKSKGGRTVGTIWVLSIPSFQWASFPFTSKTGAAELGPRISPKCQAIGEHYIFCYGGRNTLGYEIIDYCDKKANAAFLLDINTSTWTDEFNPNEGTYEIPSEVLALIGGHKKGGSRKRAPTNGWSHPDLETVMTLNVTPIPSGKNVGAIAGGTVGGVAAVVLGLLGAMALRHRRQRKSHLSTKPVELPSTETKSLREGVTPAELME